MTRTIDGPGIRVREQAVGGGAVPHIAAIAADRDGVFSEGGAGALIVSEAQETSRPPRSSGSCR